MTLERNSCLRIRKKESRVRDREIENKGGWEYKVRFGCLP